MTRFAAAASGVPAPLTCPLCGRPARDLVLVAEHGDSRVYGCAACLARAQRADAEVRTRGLGALAQW